MEIRYRIHRPLPLAVAFRVEGFTALLGPSGAGKTTLLKALAGLLPAEGTPYAGLPPEKRPIGYLPQNAALFPHLTAWQNVAFALPHLRSADREKAARTWLHRFGLAHRAEHRPRELSGGEARRVALARALARNPELLLLDEPTAGLDRPNRDQVLRAILYAVEEHGVRALVATHDLELAQAANRLAVLDEGQLLQSGPSEEVHQNPISLRVARLLGFENLIPGRVVGYRSPYVEVATRAGVLRALGNPLPQGTPAVLAVRPEEVLIVREDRPLHPRDAANTIAGAIRRLRRMGPVVEAEFEGPVPLLLRLPRHVQDRLELRPGEPRRVVLKPRYLQLFSEDEAASFSSD